MQTSNQVKLNFINFVKLQKLIYTYSLIMPKVTLTKKTQKKGVIVKKEFCSICLSDIKPAQRATINSCDHVYCKKCINKWSKTENSCPQCRAQFTEIRHPCRGKDKIISVAAKAQRKKVDHRMLMFAYAADVVTSITRVWQISKRRKDLLLGNKFAYLCKDLVYFMQLFSCRKFFFEHNRGRVSMWDIPHGSLYSTSCRNMVIIMFTHDESFRQELINVLGGEGDPSRYKQVTAHMIFNILNRLFTLSQVSIGDADEDTATSSMKRDFKRCHDIVFPKEKGHLVNLELSEQRIEHPPLTEQPCICFNLDIVNTVYKILKGKSDQDTLRAMQNAVQIQSELRNGESNILSRTREDSFPLL